MVIINYKRVNLSLQLLRLLLLLLMLAGDVEANPGPFTCEQVDEYMSMTDAEALEHLHMLHNMLRDIQNHQNRVQERLHKEAILLFYVSALASGTPCFDDTTQ